MEKEIWKDIKGYEGKYQASSFGRIKRNKTFKFGKMYSEIIMKTRYSMGYKIVNLFKEKKQKTFFVHRLVASTFLFNDDKLKVVNHKDGIKTNNKVENLEWVTRSENKIHALKNNLARDNIEGIQKNNVEVSKKIKVYDKNNKYLGTFEGSRKAANFLIENKLIENKKENTVSRAIRKAVAVNKEYYGFSFKKITDFKYGIKYNFVLIKVFQTLDDMAEWLLKNRIKEVTKNTLIRKIRKTIRNNKKYHGFEFVYNKDY